MDLDSKKMRQMCIAVVCCFLFGTRSIADATAESYACITDMVTGFRFTGQEWRSVDFKPNGKYVIRPARDDDKTPAKWLVVSSGESLPLASCETFNEHGWLEGCRGFSEFKFNKKTLKFLSAYLIGYVNVDQGKENDNTPSIEIGKCTSL